MVGGFVMIVCKGKVVYSEIWGECDCEVGKFMIMDMIFCIYLMLKLIISVVVMMLYEEGYFFFNDFVVKYIFEFVDLCVVVLMVGGIVFVVDGMWVVVFQLDNVMDVFFGEICEVLCQFMI